MSPLNNFRKKRTSITLREDELLAERVGSHPYLCKKTFKEHEEKDILVNAWETLLKNQILKTMLSIQSFFVFSIAFTSFILVFFNF